MVTRSKIIASLSGIGNLSKDGRALAVVGYRLSVYQELEPTEASIVPHQKLDGSLSVEGKIRARETRVNFDLLGGIVGDTLTLHLDDGRCLDIVVRNSVGDVTAVGGFYEPA